LLGDDAEVILSAPNGGPGYPVGFGGLLDFTRKDLPPGQKTVKEFLSRVTLAGRSAIDHHLHGFGGRHIHVSDFPDDMRGPDGLAGLVVFPYFARTEAKGEGLSLALGGYV